VSKTRYTKKEMIEADKEAAELYSALRPDPQELKRLIEIFERAIRKEVYYATGELVLKSDRARGALYKALGIE
jgi:hypothetical protein